MKQQKIYYIIWKPSDLSMDLSFALKTENSYKDKSYMVQNGSQDMSGTTKPKKLKFKTIFK